MVWPIVNSLTVDIPGHAPKNVTPVLPLVAVERLEVVMWRGSAYWINYFSHQLSTSNFPTEDYPPFCSLTEGSICLKIIYNWRHGEVRNISETHPGCFC